MSEYLHHDFFRHGLYWFISMPNLCQFVGQFILTQLSSLPEKILKLLYMLPLGVEELDALYFTANRYIG